MSVNFRSSLRKKIRALKTYFVPTSLCRLATLNFSRVLDATPLLSVATPAEPRGEKILLFCTFLGGEKLLEKCR